MVLRHNDTRRRRLAIDPHHPGVDTGEVREMNSTPEPRKRNRTLYKSGAERRSQWKTTDLFPKRIWGMVATMSCLVLAIVGLNFLFLYSTGWQNYLGSSGVAALQLSGRATLAAWFSSFLLIISGFASLQIYALRQHRQDDYRGSYRLWLWMAAILLLASVNCIIDLTSMGTHLIQALTQLSFRSSLSSLIAIKVALLTGLVARGSYEVRESRTALALVVLVWLAHGAAATLQLPQLHPVLANVDGQAYQLSHGNLLLAGTAFLLAAHLVFARFVYLQALGLIQPQTAKKKKAKAKTKAKTQAKTQAKSKQDPSEKSTATTAPRKIKSSRADQQDADQADRENDAPVQSEPAKSKVSVAPAAPTQLPPVKTNSVAAEKSQPRRTELETEAELESEDNPAVLKLSKSQQRRQRKQEQSHRRAA